MPALHSAKETPQGSTGALIIYELPQALAGSAAPLFKTSWFDEAFIDAFFEGRDIGRLFVDNPHLPSAALLCRTFEYYVAGDPGSLALRQFIKDAPAEVGVFQQLYGYCPVDNAWVDALLTDQEGRLENIGRIGFKYPHSAIYDWRRSLPHNAVIQPIDRGLAERIDAEMRQLIGLFWNGYDRYAAGGFGFCTLIDGAIASIAYAITVSANYANIDVETAAPFRQQGLCTLTSAAFIDYCLQHNLIATWDADTNNAASLATARKLGFQEYPPFSQLSPRQGTKPFTSQGRWTKETQSRGMSAEITVWRSSG
jgi:RimJ/RimL family protein N-acetyltransferase